jgi:hypothetical protein
MADDDEAGHKRAQKVVGALGGIAADVSVRLPAAGHKDIAEHLGAGRGLDELRDFTTPHILYERTEFDGPPMPLEREPAPFPLDALPQILRNVVVNVAGIHATPIDLPAMIAVGVAIAAVRGHVTVRVNAGWNEPVLGYVCVAAHSGESKSPAVRQLASPLAEAEAIYVEQTAHTRAVERAEYEAKVAARRREEDKLRGKTGGGSTKALADAVEALDGTREPVVPVFSIGEDSTPESIARIAIRQGGTLAVITPEMADLFRQMVRYQTSKQPNIGALLRGHDGDPYTIARAGQETESTSRLCLNIVGTIQTGVLDEIGRNGNDERGLNARLWLAVPRSNAGYRPAARPPLDEAAASAYRGLIHELALSDEVRELSVDADAIALVDSWYERHEPRILDDLAPIAAWANKARGAAYRIGGIIHLTGERRHENNVDRDEMERALALVDYLESHQLRAAGITTADATLRDAKYVADWFVRKGHRSFTHREAHHALQSRFPTSDDVARALDALVDLGWVARSETESGPKGGRPSTLYTVNPAVFT